MFMVTGRNIGSKCERRHFYRHFSEIAITESSLTHEILAIGWICIAGNSVPEIRFLVTHRFLRNVHGNRAMYCLKLRATPFYRPFSKIAIAESSPSQEILAIGWICKAPNSLAEKAFLAMSRFPINV